MVTVRVIYQQRYSGSESHRTEDRQEWIRQEIGDEEFHSLTPLGEGLFVLATKPISE